ncbi:ATP-dependent DNA ligase [Actinacidiphila guanduensis]|uniref:ATP-dependent DNA ligase n=1 Tax=Actinacidiphila guanduensis TaxID=310781 RepID=UPI002AFFE0A0|nr:hypothetical protein [Actinacidiphila guanduensis]
MLAAAVDSPVSPVGSAGEPKSDGYRALLAGYADGRVVIRSRRGPDMTAASPEITAAARSLRADVGVDGEVVVSVRATSRPRAEDIEGGAPGRPGGAERPSAAGRHCRRSPRGHGHPWGPTVRVPATGAPTPDAPALAKSACRGEHGALPGGRRRSTLAGRACAPSTAGPGCPGGSRGSSRPRRRQ